MIRWISGLTQSGLGAWQGGRMIVEMKAGAGWGRTRSGGRWQEEAITAGPLPNPNPRGGAGQRAQWASAGRRRLCREIGIAPERSPAARRRDASRRARHQGRPAPVENGVVRDARIKGGARADRALRGRTRSRFQNFHARNGLTRPGTRAGEQIADCISWNGRVPAAALGRFFLRTSDVQEGTLRPTWAASSGLRCLRLVPRHRAPAPGRAAWRVWFHGSGVAAGAASRSVNKPAVLEQNSVCLSPLGQTRSMDRVGSPAHQEMVRFRTVQP
ncbi:hypothetical protein C8T65DRAFT_106218 [Cerioporus squamosus]|nr:hypothetical protein C8T65DRAFT_106218 [Cerioporus squamosus]